MDELKKYIDEHRAQFELPFDAQEELWQNIDSNMHQSKSLNIYKLLIWVCLIALMFVALFFLNTHFCSRNLEMAEFNDVEYFYSKQVALKMQNLNAYEGYTYEDKLELQIYLEELEIEIANLKKELDQNINSQQFVSAVIFKFRKRIEVLDHLIQNKDQKFKNDEETISL